MRIARHRKIAPAMLATFREEAHKRAGLLPYKQLATDSGLSLRSVQQLMYELMREEREGPEIVHRGTEEVQLDELIAELSNPA